MLVTLGGIMTLVKPHAWNARFPMFVTLWGISTPIRLPHHANAPISMLVTVLGIATLTTLVSENANSPIVETLRPPIVLGIVRPRPSRCRE